MANTQELKKPQVYGGAYDEQINDLYGQLQNRPDFAYDVDGDALYQQYKDRYTQNAKRSMKDTMGRAATLTGGYGSTYSQGVGQQAYDETMRGLTDKIPELESRAFARYQKQGEDILTRYNLANQLGATDQATRQYQQEWDFQQKQYADKQMQQAYGDLSNAIMTSGYMPNADELAAAGMTPQQANALRNAWISANPGAAYIQGALSAKDYFKLTGQYPPDVLEQQRAAAAGGGWGYHKPKDKNNGPTVTDIQQGLHDVGYHIPVTGKADLATATALESYQNRDTSAFYSSANHKNNAVLDSFIASLGKSSSKKK